MGEKIKDRVILVLAVFNVIFLLSTISSCSNADKERKSFQQEKLSRFNFEEKFTKLTQEKAVLDQKLKSAEASLEAEKSDHDATKRALTQEQLVAQSVKEELEKVSRLKERLEDDLKEALAENKAAGLSTKTKK